jgi:hypothetical protein
MTAKIIKMSEADRRAAVSNLKALALRRSDRCAEAGDRGAERDWRNVAACCSDYSDACIAYYTALAGA